MSDHADSRLKLSPKAARAVWGIVCFQKLNPVEQLSEMRTQISRVEDRDCRCRDFPRFGFANEPYVCVAFQMHEAGQDRNWGALVRLGQITSD